MASARRCEPGGVEAGRGRAQDGLDPIRIQGTLDTTEISMPACNMTGTAPCLAMHSTLPDQACPPRLLPQSVPSAVALPAPAAQRGPAGPPHHSLHTPLHTVSVPHNAATCPPTHLHQRLGVVQQRGQRILHSSGRLHQHRHLGFHAAGRRRCGDVELFLVWKCTNNCAQADIELSRKMSGRHALRELPPSPRHLPHLDWWAEGAVKLPRPLYSPSITVLRRVAPTRSVGACMGCVDVTWGGSAASALKSGLASPHTLASCQGRGHHTVAWQCNSTARYTL